MSTSPPLGSRSAALAAAAILCLVPLAVDAQPWSGILAPSRATDWTTAGVVGGIPSGSWPNCTSGACNVVFGGSVTTATVEGALASAPANSVVRIPAGSFSLAGGLKFTRSDVALRGAGSTATRLNIPGTVTGGGLGLPRAISFLSGATGVGSFGGFESANWTAGYAQNATVITLSNSTGITAGPVGTGTLLLLDQLNDGADGWPAPGDLYVCENGTPCSNQGGNNYARPGRAQVQVVTAVACSPGCPSGGPTQVTISPGLAMPNWRASQSPGAYWVDSPPLHNSGLENLSVDFTDGGGSGIFIKDAANCWLNGIRWIKTDPGTSEAYHVFTIQSAHLTIRSNYVYGRPTPVFPFPLANYSYTDQEVSDIAYENNIHHHNVGPLIPNDPASRNVYAYNFVVGGYLGAAGMQQHSGAVMMSLMEGNNWATFLGDIIHGPHYFGTLFRNHTDGYANNAPTTTNMGLALHSHNRFFNVVGSVFGDAHYVRYETLLDDIPNDDDAVYVLGWQGNASGGTVANDPDVIRTLLRWGNYDSVNDAVRFVASEVPSGIPNFPNPVPASQTLPPSFYLTAIPAWWETPWGTPPWPAIGPDVTGGPLAFSGGHAYAIPARLCFEHLPDDPAYPSSDPRVKSFDAATCYPESPVPVGLLSFAVE